MFLLAFPLHFIYEWTNNIPLIGFIAPINESIFEHTKLIATPLLIFYIIYYIKNKYNIDKGLYFFSSMLSIVLGILLIPMLYYGYSESIGRDIMIIDILITYVVLYICNIHFYTYYKSHSLHFKPWLSIFILTLIYTLYIYTYYNFIDLPIFIP